MESTLALNLHTTASTMHFSWLIDCLVYKMSLNGKNCCSRVPRVQGEVLQLLVLPESKLKYNMSASRCFMSASVFLFSIIPNEERAYVAACGLCPFFRARQPFYVLTLCTSSVKSIPSCVICRSETITAETEKLICGSIKRCWWLLCIVSLLLDSVNVASRQLPS